MAGDPAPQQNPLVRGARPADAGALASIDQRVNATPWSRHRYRELCAFGPDSGYSVLVRDGAPGVSGVTGFIVVSRVLDEGTVLNIAVDMQHQGRGYGRELLSAALALLQQSGARRCLLEVRRSNLPARRLYESLGFSVDGARRNYYSTDGGREDALLMSLLLSNELPPQKGPGQ